mgnify:CR=1 FL=1
MLNIKKILSVVVLVLIIASPLMVSAQKVGDAPTISKLSEVTTISKNIVNWIIVMFWILTVFFLIWAAIIYLTAGGEEDKLKEAKNRVIYALIAGVIALLSTGLSAIVTNLLGTTSGT